jgi:DNA-binding CsgD family transcriptional regulator/ribosomal protein S18 acetylase RimI-like enzyme
MPERSTPAFSIERVHDGDRARLADAVAGAWGSDRVLSRGRLIEPVSTLPGFVARAGDRVLGFVLLRVEDEELEVVALLSVRERAGVGTALLEAARAEATRLGCRRTWLVTTNDNLHAIRFYQRRGWEWVGFHRDSVTASRALKPELNLLGDDGIAIRHELEFEAPGDSAAQAAPALTARELEVLAWVARGETNAEVAQRLWLSPGTVRTHLAHAYAKLGVRTRTAAAARLHGVRS